jgi:hypothetical protein
VSRVEVIQRYQSNDLIAGVDVEETRRLSDSRGPKQQGVTNVILAKSLKAELTSLLAQPLRQRLNSKFFTGGTSQAVARALTASARAATDRVEDGTVGEDACVAIRKAEAGQAGGLGVVAAGAMQESIAEATRISRQKVVNSKVSILAVGDVMPQKEKVTDSQRKGKKKGRDSSGKKDGKGKSLSELRSAALFRALAERRVKKLGKGARCSGGFTVARDPTALLPVALLQGTDK